MSLDERLDEWASAFVDLEATFQKTSPVSDEEVSGSELILGQPIPEEILAYWRWSNGTLIHAKRVRGSGYLFPGGVFRRLDESLVSLDVERSRASEPPGTPHPLLVPNPALMVADFSHLVWVVVSLAPETQGRIFFWKGVDGVSIETPLESIESFVDLQLELLRAGALTESSHGPMLDPQHSMVQSQPDWFKAGFDIV